MLTLTRCWFALIVVSAFFLLLIPRASSTIQQKERIIEQKAAPNEPVKIKAVKNRRANLTIGSKFKDDKEWLRGFTINLTNTHHKPIQYVSIELLVPRSDYQSEPPVADTLTYGRDPERPGTSSKGAKQIMPGETVVLTLNDTQYQDLLLLLDVERYDRSIVRVRLRLEEVVFEDGTKWLAGIFFRRDEENPERWVPIEPEPDPNQMRHQGSDLRLLCGMPLGYLISHLGRLPLVLTIEPII